MAQPLSGLDMMNRARLADAQLRSMDARTAQIPEEIAMRRAQFAETQARNRQLADYQQAAMAASERRAAQAAQLQREGLNLRREELRNRPRPQGQIVTTAEGLFERTPDGLKPLTGPDGKPLKPKVGEKPITEFQGKNALYGSRAMMADQVLNNLEDKISQEGLAMKQGVQGTPVIGGVLGAAGNMLLSANQQSVEQAQRNFVNAVLRQESGAVISEPEFENAKKQYFRQPGDSEQVVAQKRANRQAAIQGFKKIAGPAWSEVDAASGGKQIKRTGTLNGRKVVEYADGTVEYQ